MLDRKIHALRKQKGLTLEKLAEQVGSSKSYIWELENKSNLRPSAELVYKLSIALGVTVESLMSDWE